MTKRKLLLVAYFFFMGSGAFINAQTTLSGDHVITGKLNVGTTGALGGVEIVGQTGNTALPGIKLTGDGGVLFSGTVGVGHIPVTGPGARFMWYPGKGALRVGVLTDSYGLEWDDVSIGVGSIATSNSTAVGDYTVAMGGGWAYGEYSTALTAGSTDGDYSTAMSGGYTYGVRSTAASGGSAYGTSSTAISGGYTIGLRATAASDGMAFGAVATALSGGQAEADYSTAAGPGAVATSFGSFAVGRYNSFPGGENLSSWNATDTLFVVGNGTGNSEDSPEVQNHNAFTVFKNGKIKMDRQGDIAMGDFGTPGSGD